MVRPNRKIAEVPLCQLVPSSLAMVVFFPLSSKDLTWEADSSWAVGAQVWGSKYSHGIGDIEFQSCFVAIFWFACCCWFSLWYVFILT